MNDGLRNPSRVLFLDGNLINILGASTQYIRAVVFPSRHTEAHQHNYIRAVVFPSRHAEAPLLPPLSLESEVTD